MSRRPARMCPEFFVLTALAILTRCWTLFDPRVVVWDEVHFERFISSYFTGRYYLDVHPPLGKLLLAGAARVLGVSGAALAANEPAPMARLLPALAGAFIVPVVYLLMRELGGSRKVATLAAALLLVDNGLLALSRFILIDSMLILFGMSAVLCYVSARTRHGASRWTLLTLAAIAAGMAAGTKWTGLSALGLISLAWFVEAAITRRRDWAVVGEGVVLLLVPIVVYTVPFAIHFALLRHSGSGDSAMSPQFQATLEGNARYVNGASMSFWRAFAELHRVMLAINIGWATDKNAASSAWYTWPIAKHSIGFWVVGQDRDPVRWIILFGNPVVWWSVIYGAGRLAVGALARQPALVPHRDVLLFLTAGYALNFVPFAFIQRPMYLYHYFFALIFSVMLVVYGVGAWGGWLDDDEERLWQFATRRASTLYFGFIAVSSLTFLYLAPITYGRPLSTSELLHRRWVLERRMSLLRVPESR